MNGHTLVENGKSWILKQAKTASINVEEQKKKDRESILFKDYANC